jgi:F-type H+-transporting ATPase subunit epsilon
MQLRILTPEKILFEGDIDSITLPTPDGIITALPKHTSLVTPLTNGEVKVKNKSGEKKFLASGGVFEVSHNKAVMLLRNQKKTI